MPMRSDPHSQSDSARIADAHLTGCNGANDSARNPVTMTSTADRDDIPPIFSRYAHCDARRSSRTGSAATHNPYGSVKLDRRDLNFRPRPAGVVAARDQPVAMDLRRRNKEDVVKPMAEVTIGAARQ
jgi:hypothetical protein